MSVHVLGNAQLVTKQEVEELINKAAVSEEVVDSKIEKAVESVSTVIDGVQKGLQDSIDKVQEGITDQSEDISKSLKEHFKELEKGNFEDALYCTRLKNLPVAQITIDLKGDKTYEKNDVIATVSGEYLPSIPVTFYFVAELIEEKTNDEGAKEYEKRYYGLTVRLDASGNVVVINKTLLTDAYVGNVGSATVMYITKE